MENVLDFYARTHTAFLHANGPSGTAFLLEKMRPLPGQRVLEIGFGTGQTLVEVACRFPRTELFGLEKSSEMLRAARQRFSFTGLDGSRFLEMPTDLRFPFPDSFFDLIYCESVLSILPDKDLEKIWQEIHRILRPGGSLFFNESLWRDGVPAEKIEAINQQCRDWFGIQQASETHRFPSDWQILAEKHGFRVLERVPLHGNRTALPRRFDFRLFRSRIFSVFGKMKARFSPTLRAEKSKIARQVKMLWDDEPYLEGVLFHCQKVV